MAILRKDKNIEIAQQKVELTKRDAAIYDLELRLANREGANEALLAMQDRYEEKIKNLEQEIEQMNSSAENQQQTMGKTLKAKEAEIILRQGQLDAIKKVLDDRESTLLQLSDALLAALKDIDTENVRTEIRQGQLKLILTEKLLFRRGSVTRLNEKGELALGAVSNILQEYPSIFVQIIGHTDNKPPEIKSYKDNWNFSVLRAATIVRKMVNEYDFSPNQLQAAGKGEFEPTASNEESAGRASNRRIEFLIGLRQGDLVRQIRGQLKEDPK